MTSELDKFTTCDLLKTYDKLSEHLSKNASDKMSEIVMKYGGAEMARSLAKEAKDYDPNEQTPKTTVEEKNLPPGKNVSEDKNAKVEKAGEDGYPPADVEMTPDTQADVLQQILEAIQDLKATIAQMNGGEEPAPVPDAGAPVKMGSDKKEDEKDEEEKVEKDAPVVPSEKQIASIVIKALDAKFAELGITKTKKPGENAGHPIAKTGESLDMNKLSKMSWNDIHAYTDRLKGE